MSPCVKMAPDGSSAVRAVIRHGVSGAAVSISAPSKCGTRLSNVSVPSSDDAIAPACAESRSSRSRVASPSPAFDNANRTGWRRGRPGRRALVLHEKAALAAQIAAERAHVAAELQSFESDLRAARGVMQRNAAGQIEPIARQCAEIEFTLRWRDDTALVIQTDIQRAAVARQLRRPPFAAQQCAEAELDIALVGAQPCRVFRRTDRELVQPQDRRGQQPGIQRALATHRRADNARSLGLELW